MVRLHALDSMNEDTTALEVVGVIWCGDGTGDSASRPESMSHLTPRLFGVGSVVGCSVIPDLEARRGAFENKIDESGLVSSRLDGILIGRFVQSNVKAVSIERGMIILEAIILKGV
jgi:hypothetical protein